MTPPLAERRCMSCKHSRMAGSKLRCHRYPPALVSTAQGTTQLCVDWPEVASNTVCGEWAAPEPKPVPTPETPKRGMDAADLAMHAETVGRTKEREDVINWLTEAQFHVVTQDEVRVILKIREQIKAGRHVPKVRP